jgi:hypothetical protein
MRRVLVIGLETASRNEPVGIDNVVYLGNNADEATQAFIADEKFYRYEFHQPDRPVYQKVKDGTVFKDPTVETVKDKSADVDSSSEAEPSDDDDDLDQPAEPAEPATKPAAKKAATKKVAAKKVARKVAKPNSLLD